MEEWLCESNCGCGVTYSTSGLSAKVLCRNQGRGGSDRENGGLHADDLIDLDIAP